MMCSDFTSQYSSRCPFGSGYGQNTPVSCFGFLETQMETKIFGKNEATFEKGHI